MPSIDAKKAAISARKYLEGIAGNIKNVSIEEIEISNNHWIITLGYDEADELYPFTPSQSKRKYKVFRVKETDGKVISMKIKTF